MQKFPLRLAIGSFFAFCLSSSAFAQPDPRDSVILESKTIAPGVGSPAAVVGVYITNKDTLVNINLALMVRSINGGAYMTLAWPRSFDGVTSSLNTPLRNGYAKIFNGNHYNSVTPDTFILALIYDPLDIPGTTEPPNSVRKRLLEIKFDSILSNEGKVELDSAFVKTGRVTTVHTSFIFDTGTSDSLNSNIVAVSVNFVKATITVAEPARGDMDGNGAFSILDAMLLTNCVFLEGNFMTRADVTCDGSSSPSDVVAILRRVFLELPLPQCPS